MIAYHFDGGECLWVIHASWSEHSHRTKHFTISNNWCHHNRTRGKWFHAVLGTNRY